MGERHYAMQPVAEEAGEAVVAGHDAGEELCLRDMPEGAPARVRKLRGCEKTLSRLCALGITPGVEIILCGKGRNGCRIQVRDTCVVLDCDCAGSILCAPPHSESGSCGHHGFWKRHGCRRRFCSGGGGYG